VTAEDVHRAAVEVYREHGLGDAYRTERALGCSALEKPELKEGDLSNAHYWYRRAGKTQPRGSLEAEWEAIAKALTP